MTPEGPKKRRRRLIAAGGAVLMGLAGGGTFAALSGAGSGSGNVLVAQTHGPAPQFSLPALSPTSRTVSLAGFRGHDLVVNFWASWCIPCRVEMPLLESAYRSERGKVMFVGIDTNDTRSAAQSFLRRERVTYPTAFDPNGEVASEYGLFGLPVSVFISAVGKVAGRHIGQIDAPSLQAALHEAFGGASGS